MKKDHSLSLIFFGDQQLPLRSVLVKEKLKLNFYQPSCVSEALGGSPWSLIYLDYIILLIKAQSIV